MTSIVQESLLSQQQQDDHHDTSTAPQKLSAGAEKFAHAVQTTTIGNQFLRKAKEAGARKMAARPVVQHHHSDICDELPDAQSDAVCAAIRGLPGRQPAPNQHAITTQARL
eukprot:CAMPEP_0114547288 /NCGR_PEP_ID=MMETSP0114-20121206/4385_1 /TAXON_ID=31324 /ORGANISM="Goniomonas sp, Strain m" /LENGTH=110 /DNA_ID=CAMNT_0001731835 /DNA_START=30 /DNA_END=363 /DNA_ORIENTATION=-